MDIDNYSFKKAGDEQQETVDGDRVAHRPRTVGCKLKTRTRARRPTLSLLAYLGDTWPQATTTSSNLTRGSGVAGVAGCARTLPTATLSVVSALFTLLSSPHAPLSVAWPGPLFPRRPRPGPRPPLLWL